MDNDVSSSRRFRRAGFGVVAALAAGATVFGTAPAYAAPAAPARVAPHVAPGADGGGTLADPGDPLSNAGDPSLGHRQLTSGNITIDAFYCSPDHPTQTYTVPKDVHSLYVEAVGGQGQTPNEGASGLGGLGGQVSGGLNVNPGDQFTVDVGCAGTASGGASAYAAGGAAGTGWENQNAFLTIFSTGYGGGGGGGASAVMQGSNAIAIAGGGGGAGGSAPDCYMAKIGQAWFLYCGGGAEEDGGNGGNGTATIAGGGSDDTVGGIGENNNASDPTPDGSTCGQGNAGLAGSDFHKTGGGGAGGGGGGGYNGGCGGLSGQEINESAPTHYHVSGSAGNGGGGGGSYASSSLNNSSISRADDSGDGYVLFLTSADGVRTTSYGFTGHDQSFCVPDGVDEIFVDALGGAGGGGGHMYKGVANGGGGGGVQAVVPVTERTQLRVAVGGYGWSNGNWGDGHGGHRGTAAEAGDDGAGGGGSTAVQQSTTGCGRSPLAGLSYLVVAGGGGGGGGDGVAHGEGGGNGGAGGNPGTPGGGGSAPYPGYGGCGGEHPGNGCRNSINGGNGDDGDGGGAGGGGGGGYNSGNGGGGTHDIGTGGGGGGGGGASYVTPRSPQTPHYYVGAAGNYNNRNGINDGHVDLIVPVPSTRSQFRIVSGNQQSADPGKAFAHPVVVKYVDALSSAKVAGVPVTITVQPDASGHLPATLSAGSSQGTVIHTTTDAQGQIQFTATSASTRDAGQFSVLVARSDDAAGLIKPAAVTLFSAQFATTMSLTSSNEHSHDGDAVQFTAHLSPTDPDERAISTGTVQFLVDGTDLGAPVPVVGGIAVSGQIATLAPGDHRIVAAYNDAADGVNQAQGAGILQSVADTASVSVAVSSSDADAVAGDKVTYTATLTPGKDLGPVSGTVQFSNGTTDIGGPVPVGPDGVAVSPPSTLAVPADATGGLQHQSIHAAYSGGGNYAAGAGDYVQQVRWHTALNIASSAPYGDYTGADLTFTGTVAGDWPAGHNPPHTGTMQVYLGSTPIGAAFPVDGTSAASPPIPAATLGTGVHEISIHYSGDANYGPAVSATYYQVVFSLGTEPGSGPGGPVPGKPGGQGSSTPPGSGFGVGPGVGGLPATGSDVGGPLGLAGLLLAAGAGLAALEIRRRKIRRRM